MARDVVERFFYRKKKIVPHLSGNGLGRRMIRHIHMAGDIRGSEELDSELADVADHVRQHIIFRVDGPNNLIERVCGLSRGGRDLLEVLRFGTIAALENEAA